MLPTIACGRRASPTRGDWLMDTGEGGLTPFAAAIKAGRFPSSAVLEALEQGGANLREQHKILGAAIDEQAVHRQRLAEALRGQAGDGALTTHAASTRLWEAHEGLYPPAADAVVNAVGELRNLQSDLNLLIQDKEPKYKEAL